RAIDLTTETVTRVAGTGNMATYLLRPGDALDSDLRSPWDLTNHDGVIYIAMAGTHQLWTLDVNDMRLNIFAGNGTEELIDGPRLDAELAQPSGVATDGQYVYFADSEGSAVRRAGISETGEVETLIGPVNEEQARLFTFGDVDGDIDEARLQHPLGVTIAEDGSLFIADTYNNKIKLIDPAEKTSTTFAGETAGGYFDGTGQEALFDEPGGLDYSDGKLYIADTNNHAIRIVDIESQSVSTVLFPNVNILLSDAVAFVDTPFNGGVDTAPGGAFGGETLVLPPQTVAPGEGLILVDAVMPFGYKLNAAAPFTAQWAGDEVVTVAEDQRDYQVITPEMPIEFPVTLSEGETSLSVDLTIYWCEAIKETLCFVERGTVVMPVTVSSDAVSSVLSLSYELTPPDIPENT
ncbi:MAG TPA: hypothetical protein VJZ27_09695, partial [Aggregatilineales bacterium]|nr:hypothetical protein [Aggregatilineales bacterium]